MIDSKAKVEIRPFASLGGDMYGNASNRALVIVLQRSMG